MNNYHSVVSKSLVLGFSLFFLSVFSYAQTNNIALPQPVPPSPTAASLGKYGEIPVGKYTGVPDISIPLWQIDEGDIHVPISLSYHASGVKVEQSSSWVGLGWSLNAGGVITRSMRGKPDEVGYLLNSVYDSPGGLPGVTNALPSYLTGYNLLNNNASDCDIKDAASYLFNVMNGDYDSEPDIYFFNFNGYSGKFVLDQNGNAYTIPYQKINIHRVDNNSWTITTPEGMIYTFATPELTNSFNLGYATYGGSTNDNSGTKRTTFVSSWFLSTIQSPTRHQVTFSYDQENSDIISGTSQALLWTGITTANDFYNPTLSNSGTESQIQGYRLKQINFSNGSVNFIATKVRTDVSAVSNPNLLEKIVINNLGGPIKQFVFNTDYFTSADAVQSFNTRRLRLNSVTEWNGAQTLSKTPYIFSYDSTYPLPSKISTSQDH